MGIPCISSLNETDFSKDTDFSEKQHISATLMKIKKLEVNLRHEFLPNLGAFSLTYSSSAEPLAKCESIKYIRKIMIELL